MATNVRTPARQDDDAGDDLSRKAPSLRATGPTGSENRTPGNGSTNAVGTQARGLAEAARLFAEHGYAGTSMRQIADAMDLTMGTIYHYFASKEEILYQICRSTLSDGFDRLERTIASLPPDASDIDAISACLIAHVETITDSLNAQTTMLTELRSLQGNNRVEIASLRRRYASRVEDIIHRGQTSGAIRSDLPAAVITLFFFDLTNWMIFWFRQEGRMRADELARAMASVLLDGIRSGNATPMHAMTFLKNGIER